MPCSFARPAKKRSRADMSRHANTEKKQQRDTSNMNHSESLSLLASFTAKQLKTSLASLRAGSKLSGSLQPAEVVDTYLSTLSYCMFMCSVLSIFLLLRSLMSLQWNFPSAPEPTWKDLAALCNYWLFLSLSLTFSNHVESCQIVLNQNMWIPFLTHWSWVAAHQRGWAWAPGSCAAAPARCCSWRQISKTLGIELWSPRQHQIRNGRVHGTIWHPMYHGENGLCLVTSCDPTLSWQSSQTTLSKSCASGYTAATLRNSTSLSNDMRLMPQRQVMQASQAFHSIPNIDKARTSESPYQEVYGPWFLWDIFTVLQASNG